MRGGDGVAVTMGGRGGGPEARASEHGRRQGGRGQCGRRAYAASSCADYGVLCGSLDMRSTVQRGVTD
jgi:hypothetical protein